MRLSKLINEGEKIEKKFTNRKEFNEKNNRWINKSLSYLKENYPKSVLTNDFILESEKIDKNYHNMVAILKGLKDVEEELDLLNE
ncbi:hypothetical protein [Paramaledivibacter caminithermalis]|jgi:hypothetical protein|uniref:Uncharacterized protein n=1 Tax=Paramaledivibacter caminithermalis (strain DSM 15212 / CIP 107654 / DViRD3) TaxID=1121301 RepID=A0A1M6LFK6_PARC5|nr:hypothetical protein [Paramaledivibacter caminithermalis]SHJ70013.1 hypothetical protein SAMN02745912_00773 [Paramaledivibacter caminithermalis DSM 15212]